MSRASARHRKPSRFSSARASTITRRRKPSLIASALRYRPLWAAAAVMGAALGISAWLAAGHWTRETPRPAAMDKADAPRPHAAGAHPGMHGGRQTGAGPMITRNIAGVSPLRATANASSASAGQTAPRRGQAQAHQQAAALPVYRNPLRGINGLIPERVDMGVDFGGSGPIYALGNAVITHAEANSAGWPGGGWITYRLTDGPDAGLMVYVAEDVKPTVQVGQDVSSSTVVADMFSGGDGIETGWAQPDGASAESQLPAAGSISGGGPFPTMIGLNFEELLQTLGVPGGSNRTQPAYGVLPANYPTSWK